MAASVNSLRKALVAVGLMSDDDVEAVLSDAPAGGSRAAKPRDADELAKLLVERRLLTEFQAKQLLAGHGAGLVMGEYVILSEIGAGGMGRVYKARHRRMDRIVALKIMSQVAMRDEPSVKRFQREVRAAAKLEHPNIVTAHDAGEVGKTHYLVMQFVDGGDLSNLVKKVGPLSIEKACDYVTQTARGLAYAHSEGLIHRDIKPANLLLDKKGVIRILDMGLARMDDGSEALTGTEQVMGTVDYMSPEQGAETKNVDARSDIYSLGCTLWYLLTGKKVYEGDTLVARLLKHRDAPLPSLVQTRDGAPYGLEQALHKMIAKRMQDRYQTMDDVIAAIKPWTSERNSPDASLSFPKDAGTGLGLPAAVYSTPQARPQYGGPPSPAFPGAYPTAFPTQFPTSMPSGATRPFGRAADSKTGQQTMHDRNTGMMPGRRASANDEAVRHDDSRLALFGAAGFFCAAFVGLALWVLLRGADGEPIVAPPVAQAQPTSGDSTTNRAFRSLPPAVVPTFPDPTVGPSTKVSTSPTSASPAIRPTIEPVTSSTTPSPTTVAASTPSTIVPVPSASPPPSAPPPQSSGPSLKMPGPWVELFNKRDIQGWRALVTSGADYDVHVPKVGGWLASSGLNSVRCATTTSGWLMSEKEYDDFELELEYRNFDAQSNSGIYLRAQPAGRISRTALEIQIQAVGLDTGAITPYLEPTVQMQRPTGQWNTMRIYCDGPKISVGINDASVFNVDLDKDDRLRNRPRSGHIGIANWQGLANGMEFRNVRLRELNVDPAGVAATPSSTAQPSGTRPGSRVGFKPLFNGHDLAGWQFPGGGTGQWAVEEGAITCRGGGFNRLFTTRNDYRDFHLQAEVMINNGGNGGLHFRTPQGMGGGGYEVQINADSVSDTKRTGSVFVGGNNIAHTVDQSFAPSSTWFKLEVIVRGNRTIVTVDGKQTTDFFDTTNRFGSGHIALEHHDPRTRIRFRKVEIREFPSRGK